MRRPVEGTVEENVRKMNEIQKEQYDSKITTGKIKPLTDFLSPFANAIEAVCAITYYGNLKHIPYSWTHGTPENYMDAAMRHFMRPTDYDEETQMIHLCAAAWNAMAALELYIRDEKDGGDSLPWNRIGNGNALTKYYEELQKTGEIPTTK